MPADTPNTIAYMIAGYAVLLGLPLLYVASWFVRRRNLEKDLDVIQSISDNKESS